MKRIFCFLLSVCLIGIAFSNKGVIYANEYNLHNPAVDEKLNQIYLYDAIYFGSYLQSDVNKDNHFTEEDKEPILWRVLSIEGDDAFVISEKVLRLTTFHVDGTADVEEKTTWEDCSLRKYLNETFFADAFTPEEQSAIKTSLVKNETTSIYDPFTIYNLDDTYDKIFLLSFSELINNKYFTRIDYSSVSYFSGAEAKCTDLVKYHNSFVKDTVSWWTRSTATVDPYNRDNSWYVWNVVDGKYVSKSISNYHEGHSDAIGIRPVLHLNLSSKVWKKAGTIKWGNFHEEEQIELDDDNQKQDSTYVNNNTEPVIINTTIAKPNKTFIKSLNNKKKYKIKIIYKNISSDGYQIQIALNKKFTKKKKTYYTTKTKYIIKRLKKNRKYYVRVRGYNEKENIKKYGKWSKIKKVKIIK